MMEELKPRKHRCLRLLIGLTMTPEFLGIRGFIHFALFLISFYFGFINGFIKK
jgi:hypothetical protein